MSKIFSLRMARQSAEKLVKDEGITMLPVDPIALARKRGIEVEGKPGDHEGVSGMLLRHGNDFMIVYATHIPNPGFQHFSVGHELGHYCLPGHANQLTKDGIHVSRAGFVTNDAYELEADHFASGLLMPEGPFRKAMDRYEPGLDAICAVADLGITSRTATAIRFAELSKSGVAVIVSSGDTIDYCFMSEPMKSLPKLDYIRKGSPLPSGTAASKLAADREAVLAGKQVADEVDVRQWLGGTERVIVSEESIGLGNYGKVLTVLVADKLNEIEDPDDDEESDDDVMERWTPRFRS
jgi:Zn-dependent peptidase ImmA (M78 family)